MKKRREFSNGAVYEGDLKGGKRHGSGRMVWPDGKVFEGVWSDDAPVKGKHTWPDGAVYDGTWNKWNREGYGVIEYAFGGRYSGEWKADKRHGRGHMSWPDGKTYDGLWVEDCP